MQLKQFTIRGLFGNLDHSIPFPQPRSDEKSEPSLVVLHGRNGIGKTTVLRMLNGMVRLDFNTFRQVPFDRCSLEFDSGDSLTIVSNLRGDPPSLDVSFRDRAARLSPSTSGPARPAFSEEVQEFRKLYFGLTEDITFEFIDTERIYQLGRAVDEFDLHRNIHDAEQAQALMRRMRANPKARSEPESLTLAARVGRFIREAQVNYRNFFSSTEPDLFPRIIERLTTRDAPAYDAIVLRQRLEKIFEQDRQTDRLGLERDQWDFNQMITQLTTLNQRDHQGRQQALTVLGSYVEVLESRAAERALVSERLFAFERLMTSFLVNKSITIDQKHGINIVTESGATLEERQLSSGEFHLLFLMVASLVTRRRGTAIAIDEPEMSMHIAWQRRLIPALLQCASNAAPLFILATHSPDLVAAFPEFMIELGQS